MKKATKERTSHVRAEVIHAEGAPALELQDLSVNFGPVSAIDKLTLRIEKGSRVAVAGPNGAGKSTLFNVIAGVIQSNSGTLLIHGHGPSRHDCIAYVTQGNHVDWTFPVSVHDVVMMGRVGRLGLFRRPGAADRDLTQRSLQVVELEDLAQRQIGELSGGQKQRMFIARALAQEADLVLLDEPLAGLDATSQDQILKILADLKRRKVTVLFATHDLELAAQQFDKILLLNRKLIAYGSRQDVFTTANLAEAYGGQMQMIETPEGRIMIGDSGGHHGHEEKGRHG
jgi:ABC-type Mn2+/Zn2+ transport system ATPase subunit